MTSIKRASHLALIHKPNRRDSGNYSESCYSEISEHRKICKVGDVKVEDNGDIKEITLDETVKNGSGVVEAVIDNDAASTDECDDVAAKSEDMKCLLSIYESKSCEDRNIAPCGISDAQFKSRHGSHGTYSYISSRTLKSPSYNIEDNGLLKKHTDIDAINRCDDLINNLQEVSQKYFELVKCYQKVKKICYLMIGINGILLICVLVLVPLLVFLLNASNGGNGENENNKDNQYQICFACSDLNHGTLFSLENLLDLTVDGESCCFKSIMPVLRSLERIFEHTFEDKTKNVEKELADINTKLLKIEVGLAPNISSVIGKILQFTAPREKIALNLLSVQGAPFGEVHEDAYTRFWKLRWFSSDRTTILRGEVQLTGNGMNIKVSSEAYYFLYSRVRFMHRETGSYKRKTPLRYLVYRKRGSISSYIQEAKLSCIFNELSQEHSITTELILRLEKDDEIFISVDDSDKQFLATESGAHSIGLFEI